MFTAFAILTRNDAVLLLKSEGGWSLPAFTSVYGAHLWQDARYINRAVARRFGMPVTTLYCLAVEENSDGSRTDLYYVLECHSLPQIQPERARWFTAPEIESLPGGRVKTQFKNGSVLLPPAPKTASPGICRDGLPRRGAGLMLN
jgi:hypothetical protein